MRPKGFTHSGTAQCNGSSVVPSGVPQYQEQESYRDQGMSKHSSTELKTKYWCEYWQLIYGSTLYLHAFNPKTNRCVCDWVNVPLTGAREGLRLSRWWKKILSLLELGGTLAMSPLALPRTRLGGWGFLNSWNTHVSTVRDNRKDGEHQASKVCKWYVMYLCPLKEKWRISSHWI